MNKLYTFFICTSLFLSSHLVHGQLNSPFDGVLPLIEMDDTWPFEFVNGQSSDLIVFEDTLYAVGVFGEFNGLAQNGILKWDGTHVHSMNSPFDFDESDWVGNNGVTAINVFQNQLVIAVNWDDQASRVYRYNGSEWSTLGNALGDHAIQDLIEWEGQLYASGTFSSPLLVLNGNNQWVSANFPMTGTIVDMEIFNGEFYCVQNNVENRLWKNDGSGFLEILTDFTLRDTKSLTVNNGELFGLGFYNTGSTSGHIVNLSNGILELLNTDGLDRVQGYFTLNGETYFVENDGITMRILDQNKVAHCVYKKGQGNQYERHGKIITYKGLVYLADALRDDTFPSGNVSSVLVFRPNKRNEISNELQFFRKERPHGIIDNAVAIGSLSSISNLYDPNLMNSSVMYLSGMIVSAVSAGERKAIADMYTSQISNWFPGPFVEEYGIRTFYKYNRVWSVTQEEIDNHINLGSSPSYVIPSSILEWPGNGDAANGESHMLAPFYDANQNTWYEPEQGDYPLIRGKEAMFWVQHGRETMAMDKPLTVDMHVLAYVEENDNLNDLSLFFHTTLINRSNETYDSLRIGMFNDFDLGNSTDDYVGCDSLLSVAYVYNGLDYDQESVSGLNYGSEVPAFGVVYLSESMEANTYYNVSTNPINGDPLNTSDVFNYMQGKLKNGEYELPYPMAPTGPMMYQDSPCGLGEENEIDLGNPSGDRRLISAGGLHTLLPDESLCFDFAYYFKPSSGDHIETLCAMLEDIPAVHAFYQQQNYNCSYINGIEENGQQLNWNVYPNPTTDIINIEIESLNQLSDLSVSVIDMQGRAAMIPTPTTQSGIMTIDLSALSNGAYMLKLDINGKTYSKVVTRG